MDRQTDGRTDRIAIDYQYRVSVCGVPTRDKNAKCNTVNDKSLRRLLNLNKASFTDVLVVLSTTCPSLEMISANVSAG